MKIDFSKLAAYISSISAGILGIIGIFGGIDQGSQTQITQAITNILSAIAIMFAANTGGN